MSALLQDLLTGSLRFEYQAGGIAPLPAGHTTGWRVLPGLMFSQAHRGAERIFLEGDRSFLARTGELIVLPAGIRHKVDVIGRSEVRRWAHVSYCFLDSLDVFSLFDLPVLLEKRLGMRIGDLIQEWLGLEPRLKASAPLEHAARANEFGFRLLGWLAPHCCPRPGLSERVEGLQRLWPVIEHVRRNFGQPLDRDGLARLAFLSSTQFHLAFKKATGETPIKFLEGIRLRHAQQLLIGSGRKMSAIARECGYQDPYVFSKFFKRASGNSPSEYRRMMLDFQRSAGRT